MGTGQDHPRRARAAACARVQRLSAAAVRRLEIGAHRFERWVQGLRERHGELRADLTSDVLTLTAADGTSARCEVPYPPLASAGLDAAAAPGPDPADAVVARAVGGLVEHVLVDRTTALLLVRRGGYAVGVVEHRQLVASKVGSRYVQGRTAAGGQSQQRFARRRANQVQALVGSAADVAARVVEPFAAALDALVLGGDRLLLAELLDDARLAGLQRLPRGPFLDVADPRRRVLDDAVRRAAAVPVLLRPGPGQHR